MPKTYVKTDKLKEAKFRGQRALVVAALNSFSTPKTIDELEAKIDANGEYTKLLNDWAKQNGAAHSSILYHLRGLEQDGMIKVEGEVEAVKPTKKKDKKTTPPKKVAEKKPPQPERLVV